MAFLISEDASKECQQTKFHAWPQMEIDSQVIQRLLKLLLLFPRCSGYPSIITLENVGVAALTKCCNFTSATMLLGREVQDLETGTEKNWQYSQDSV